MLEQNIKALQWSMSQDRVVGVLTHDDLLELAGLNARLAVAQRLDEKCLQGEMDILRQSGKQVADVMSHPAITIHPEDPSVWQPSGWCSGTLPGCRWWTNRGSWWGWCPGWTCCAK